MFSFVSVYHSVQVATEACTVGKRTVRILLECFLVTVFAKYSCFELPCTTKLYQAMFLRNLAIAEFGEFSKFNEMIQIGKTQIYQF